MRRPSDPSWPWTAAAWLAPLVLAACAADEAASMPPGGVRLIVGTVADWPSAERFAERAARVAGVPVSDVSPIGSRRYALTLRCADAAACDAAQRRLSADASFAADVQPSERRTLPPRPAPSQAL